MLLHDHVKRRGWRRRSVAADTAFDTRACVGDSRELGFTPHVTQHIARAGGSAIDQRTTRHASDAKSQHARPRIEPAFGWLKTIAWLRTVKLRGLSNVHGLVCFAAAAFNLRRLTTWMAATA